MTIANNWAKRLVPLCLVLLTVIIYANVFNGRLQYSWDDNRYIAENPYIRGLTLDNVVGLFTNTYFAAYIPVTLLGYNVQYTLFSALGIGQNGFFIVNVLLHTLNVLMVYTFIGRVVGNRVVASIAAILFAVHPVNVESVAWVSQLKSTLSLCFFLLSWLSHLQANENQQGRGWIWLIMAYILFALSIFSKQTAVGAFILFVMFDWWSLSNNVLRVLIRNLPYGLIGVLGAVSILMAHSADGGIQAPLGATLIENVAVSLRVYWEYFTALIWPFQLNNMYIYDINTILANLLPSIAGAMLLMGMVIFALWQPLGKPLCLFAITWVVVLILPTANIIPIAIQRADRYLYYPSIMIFMLLGLAVVKAWEWARGRRLFGGVEFASVLIGVSIAVVSVFAVLTTQRVAVWQNTQTLWMDHLEDYPNSVTGLLNLGVGYYYDNQLVDAFNTLTKLLDVSPNHFKGNRLMGLVLFEAEDYVRAMTFLEKAIQIAPNQVDAEMARKLGVTYFNLGLNEFNNRDYVDALRLYQLALPLVTADQLPVVVNNVGYTFIVLGRYDDAIQTYTQLLRDVKPDYPKAWLNLGNAYLYKEDFVSAQNAYQNALSYAPELDAEAYSNLCLASGETRADQAQTMGYCQKALEQAPTNVLYLGRTAHILLLYGDAQGALSFAQQAIGAGGNSLSYRVLGDAWVILGDVAQARAAYLKALELDTTNKKAQQGLTAIGG